MSLSHDLTVHQSLPPVALPVNFFHSYMAHLPICNDNSVNSEATMMMTIASYVSRNTVANRFYQHELARKFNLIFSLCISFRPDFIL